MASSWFDDSYYLAAKAAYNNAHAINGLTTWTSTSVQASLNGAGMTAEQHYSQYGWTEGLAPNAYYVESQYVASKVAALNAGAVGGKTDWTPSDFYASLNGANPFMHYVQYGAYETGVEPSTGFSDDTYYADKAVYNNANSVGGITTWTADTVKAAFQANGLTPIGHYELYGATEAFYTPTPTPNPGQTYTLTTNVDIASANEFFGVATGNAGVVNATSTWNPGDTLTGIAGGANSLTLTTANTGAATTFGTGSKSSGVQTINITSAGTLQTIDLSLATDVTNINDVSGAISNAVLTINNVQTNATIGMTNVQDGADLTVVFKDSIVSGSADSGKLTVDGVLSPTTGTDVILQGITAAEGFETLAITSENSASRLATLTSGTNKLETVTVAGDANFRVGNIASTALKSVDASAMTGTASVNIGAQTSSSAALKFVGTGNDDRLIVNGTTAAASNTFSLNGGAGTDTLAVSTATNFTVAGSAGLSTTINAATSFERLESTAAFAVGGSVLKADDYSGYNKFTFSGGANAAAATADGLTVTGLRSTDTLAVTANTNLVAAVAGAGTVAGFDAMTVTGAAVGTSTTLEIGNSTAATTVTAQAGREDTTVGGTGGAGGNAFVAGGNISTLTINSIGTAGNQILGGAGGDNATAGATGGAGGVAINNGAALAALNITGNKDLTIAGGTGGTGATAGADAAGFGSAIGVNASTFTGKLTINLSTADDNLTMGTGTGNTVRGWGGTDSITFNTGTDTLDMSVLTGGNLTDSLAANAMTLTNFDASADSVKVAAARTSVQTASAGGTGTLATDIASAMTATGGLLLNAAAVVTITGGTDAGSYLVIDNGVAGYVAGSDAVIKLTNATGTITTSNFTL